MFWTQKSKKHKRGLTLLELMIATSIFTISFGGLMIMNQRSRNAGENALVKFVAIHYQQAILESIQAYPYDEPSYDLDDPSQVFSHHDTTHATYSSMTSGIYNSSGTLVEHLPEEALSIRSYKSELPSTPTPENPFQLQGSLSDNNTLIGMEDEDHSGEPGFGPDVGQYRISEDEIKQNIFSNKNLAKYYFADDVDDFDGFREVRELYDGIYVTYEVSVMPVYGDTQNYLVEYTDTGGSVVSKHILQERFDIMKPISVANFPDSLTFNDSPNPALELMTQGLAYYKQAIFKKITVKATWEYPKGSGRTHTLVLDGGKVNPQNAI